MKKTQACTDCGKKMHLNIDPGQIMAQCPHCGTIQAILTDENTIRECREALKGDCLPPTPDFGKSVLETAAKACKAYNKSIPDGQYFDGGGS